MTGGVSPQKNINVSVSASSSLLDVRNASLSLGSKRGDVETSAERYWVLFLFGCCTMMNACGWISISPLGSLLEYVSNRHHNSTRSFLVFRFTEQVTCLSV